MNKYLEYLKRIWTGSSTKKEYIAYFCVSFFIYFLGILISALKYPGGFSMTTVYISYLGGSDKNPDGYIYYCVVNFIVGILLIPHFIFLYKRLRPAIKILSAFSCLLGIEGSIGFALIGIFHQGILPDMHQITTYMAFGGFGACAFFCVFILIRKICLKHPWPSIRNFIILYASMLSILTIALLFEFYGDFFLGIGVDPAYLNDRFLEWLYFFTVLDWIIVVMLIVSDKPVLNSEKLEKS